MSAQLIIEGSRVLVSILAVAVFYDFTTRSTRSADKFTQVVGESADKFTQAVGESADKFTQVVGESSDKWCWSLGTSSNKLSLALGIGMMFIGGGLFAIALCSTGRSNSGY